MLDAKRLLDQFLGGQQGTQLGQSSSQGQSQFGDIARGLGNALPGGLGNTLSGHLGGMALVGALAYGAYKNWQAGRAPAQDSRANVPLLPPPRDTPFNPTGEAEQQSLGLSLMRAMIAAAKSDGHIDATEQANIFTQLDKLNLSAEEKAFVLDELRKPLDVDAVARSARTPEQAAEIYVASLLAIDIDNPQERRYLASLAIKLRLDEKLVEHLHATVEGAAKQPVPVQVAS